MKTYIFITNEGYTFQPGSESSEPDIENCQVIGFSEGVCAEDAFNNMIKDRGYLLETSFNDVIGLELAGAKENYFCLNDFRNCSKL